MALFRRIETKFNLSPKILAFSLNNLAIPMTILVNCLSLYLLKIPESAACNSSVVLYALISIIPFNAPISSVASAISTGSLR